MEESIPWVPASGVNFLVAGTVVYSVLGLTDQRAVGLVAVDLKGKWEHGAQDWLSCLVHPEVAEELGQLLIEGAAAARSDEKEWVNPGDGESRNRD